MIKESDIIALKKLLRAFVAASDDKIASYMPAMSPKLKQDGKLVRAGTRINWGGVVMKAAVDLWDTAENDPDHAPTQWAALEYRDGYRIIPETITVTTAFSDGEYGWWDGVLHRSKVNSNVYTPAQYADNWEVVG